MNWVPLQYRIGARRPIWGLASLFTQSPRTGAEPSPATSAGDAGWSRLDLDEVSWTSVTFHGGTRSDKNGRTFVGRF